MKLVMTLVVRDEADILEAQLAFHLNLGVDLVVVTDHGSRDATPDILEHFARDGYAHVLRAVGGAFRQADWVTRMARMAATDFGADWVINADADEFWWPRAGVLKEILAAVPRRYGIVRGFERHFAPRPEEAGHFAERMTVRVTPHAPLTRPGDPFQGTMAVIHRADPAVTLLHGNHDVKSPELVTLRGWYPFEVLHFPLRTVEQSRQKFLHKQTALRTEHVELGRHVLSAVRALEAHQYEDWYASYVVDDAAVGPGVADGSLVVDTRLRDALRLLADVDEMPEPPSVRFPLAVDGSAVTFSPGSLADEAQYGHEMQAYDDFDSQIKAVRRVRTLERRVSALENGVTNRVRGRVQRLRSRRVAS